MRIIAGCNAYNHSFIAIHVSVCMVNTGREDEKLISLGNDLIKAYIAIAS